MAESTMLNLLGHVNTYIQNYSNEGAIDYPQNNTVSDCLSSKQYSKRLSIIKTIVSERLSIHKAIVSERLSIHKTIVSERLSIHKTIVSERLSIHKAIGSEQLYIHKQYSDWAIVYL